MAWSLVQAAGGQSVAANPTVATASSVTQNDLLVVVAHGGSGETSVFSIPTITINGVNQTVALAISDPSPLATGAQAGMWYCIASTTGACNITLTNISTVHLNYSYAEYSGVAASSPLDQTAHTPGSSTTNWSVGPSGTTTQANEIVISSLGVLAASATSITPGTGYTSAFTPIVNTNGSFTLEYEVVSSTGTQTATATTGTATGYKGLLATFLPGTGGSTPTWVQGNQSSGTTDGSKQFTVGYTAQNNAASDLLVASIATLDTVSVTGVTDGAGNTWVKAIPDTSQTGATKVSTWFVGSCLASAGGTSPFNTLTITTDTISADIGVVIGEYSGAGTVVDVSGTGSGTSNSPSVATSTATSAASELVISAIAAYANAGASTGNTSTQTEEFPTTLDNYASGGTIASGETETFDGTHDSTLHASAGSGSALSKIAGKTKGPTTGFIQQANTWTALFGIPSNATITAYSVSYDWSCTAATGPSGTPQLQLQTWHNGTAARNGTAVNGTAKTFTGTTAWATATNDINVTGLSEAATAWATFSFQPTMSTSSSSTGNVVTVNYDHIVITVTYSLPASAVSFTAGSGWGLRENTSQTGTFHADAALEDEVLATAGTATATWTLASQGGWAAQTIAFKTSSSGSFSVTLTDTIALGTESVSRTISLVPRTLSEALALGADTPSRIQTLIPRTASESIPLGVETISKAAQAFARTLSDTVALGADTLTRGAQSLLRSLTDTVTFGSDTAALGRMFPRGLSDTIALGSDALTKTPQAIVRSLSDAIPLGSQTLTRGAQTFLRSLTDTITFGGEGVSMGRLFSRSLTDTISLGSDVLTRGPQALVRSVSDTMALGSDVPSKGAQLFQRTLTENLGAGYNPEVISLAPSLYYRLDDTGATAVDSSGNGFNGTLSGSITTGVTGLLTGDTDTAMTFVAGSGQIDGGNPVALQVGSGTLVAWIKTSAPGASFRAIFGKSNAFMMFLINSIFSTYDWGSGTQRSTGINLADGANHMVAMTFQSGITNGTQLFVDGVSQLTTTITVLDQTHNWGVSWNQSANSVVQDIGGTIDECSFFSTALTPTQINNLYVAGTTGGSFSELLSRGAQSFSRTLADTITLGSDTLTRGAQALLRSLTDTITLGSDTATLARLGRTVSVTLTDTIAFGSDALSKVQSLPRTLADTMTFGSDTVSAHRFFSRALTDTIALGADVLSRANQIFTRSATDSVPLGSDTLSRGPLALVRNLTDTAILGADSLLRATASQARTLVDSIPFGSDTLTRAAQAILRSLTDTVTLGVDTISAHRFFGRSITDTIAFGSDVLSRAAQVFTRSATDSVPLGSDALMRQPSTGTRTLTDTIALGADSLLRAAQSFPRSLVDTVALGSDSLLRPAYARARTLADSIPFGADSASVGRLFLRSLTDSLPFGSDTLSRLAQVFGRSASDSVPLGAELVSRTQNLSTRQLTDTIALGADSLVRGARTLARTLTDTTALSDSLSRAAQVFGRSLIETLPFGSDTFSYTRVFTRTLADTLPLGADVLSRAPQVLIRSVLDTLSFGGDTFSLNVVLSAPKALLRLLFRKQVIMTLTAGRQVNMTLTAGRQVDMNLTASRQANTTLTATKAVKTTLTNK